MKRALLIAADILLVFLVIGLMVFGTKTGTSAGYAALDRSGKVFTELSESDKNMYDGQSLNGSLVTNAITKYKNDSLGIIVTTKKSTISYINNLTLNGNVASFGTACSSSLKNAQDINNIAYINPNAQFDGEILRDSNDVIIGLRFTQK